MKMAIASMQLVRVISVSVESPYLLSLQQLLQTETSVKKRIKNTYAWVMCTHDPFEEKSVNPNVNRVCLSI